MHFQFDTQLFSTVLTTSAQDRLVTTGSDVSFALSWQPLDFHTALRLLSGLPDRSDVLREIRGAFGQDAVRISSKDDNAILREAAFAFASGWYCVLNRVPSGGGWRGKDDQKIEYVTEAIEPEENPTGVPKKKEKDHWIIVELLGENGEPIPNELCRITLPDGQIVERETNSQGRVEEYMIIEGDCSIEFPELDKDAWEPWTGSAAA